MRPGGFRPTRASAKALVGNGPLTRLGWLRQPSATSPPGMGERWGLAEPLAMQREVAAVFTPLPHTWGRGRPSRQRRTGEGAASTIVAFARLRFGGPMPAHWLTLSAEVAAAVADRRPVVALESTLIAHGLPRPTNLETAREAE